MRYFLKLLIVSCAALATTPAAFAHAFLNRATPPVGATVQSSPNVLTLTFTENVVPAFSGVTLRADGGKTIPLGKPVLAGGNTLQMKIGRRLTPGVYSVNWHVVSVDTHHTSGRYQFTVTH